MRSKQLNLELYDSDKITNQYLERYDPIFEPWVHNKIVLLELGVYKGGSLLLWRDYFTQGTIVGIDIISPQNFHSTDRIHIYQGSQADTPFLSRIATDIAPEGFDIIIDDASHVGELTKISFWHLFDNHLKAGGIYVIEDWGTGYWDDWVDGKSLDLSKYYQSENEPSLFRIALIRLAAKMGIKLPRYSHGWPCHSYGMVGLVKQLVDEQGAADVTAKRFTDKAKRSSKFESMLITPSIVFVRKAKHA